MAWGSDASLVSGTFSSASMLVLARSDGAALVWRLGLPLLLLLVVSSRSVLMLVLALVGLAMALELELDSWATVLFPAAAPADLEHKQSASQSDRGYHLFAVLAHSDFGSRPESDPSSATAENS